MYRMYVTFFRHSSHKSACNTEVDHYLWSNVYASIVNEHLKNSNDLIYTLKYMLLDNAFVLTRPQILFKLR